MIQGGLNKKVESAEDVFKVVIVLVGIILSFCVKSILRFRDYCQESGYYIFQAESLVYCAIGFFGVWVSFSLRSSSSTVSTTCSSSVSRTC
jgi:hypothetical protein